MIGTQTMDRQERLQLGEKILVLGIMLVLATELIFTGVGLALHFTWLGLFFGAFVVVLYLFLVNWLYTGNRIAQFVLLGWVALQVLLTGTAFILLNIFQDHELPTNYIALPTSWLAGIKLAAYLVLGAILVASRPVQDFLGEKRGEPPSEKVVVEIIPSGEIVPLTAEQTSAFGVLANWLRLAGWALLVAVCLQLIQVERTEISVPVSVDPPVVNRVEVSVTPLDVFLNLDVIRKLDSDVRLKLFLQIVEVVLLFGLVLFIQVPASAFRRLAGEGNLDLAFLMNALDGLTSFFVKQVLVSLVMVVILGIGIYLRLPR